MIQTLGKKKHLHKVLSYSPEPKPLPPIWYKEVSQRGNLQLLYLGLRWPSQVETISTPVLGCVCLVWTRLAGQGTLGKGQTLLCHPADKQVKVSAVVNPRLKSPWGGCSSGFPDFFTLSSIPELWIC